MSRIAIIDRKKCIKEKCGYVCIKVCPEVRMGVLDCIKVDKEGYPVIDEILCTGCGICPKRCPTNAITIINLPQELNSYIHSYGINSFRLYGKVLVNTDRKGVFALIGKNGIGKTTFVKILANVLKPNFNKSIDNSSEIIKNLPIESRKYFNDLYENKLKFSYKPQNIERLKELYKDKKVEELLKTTKMDSNIAQTIYEEFGIEKFLDRKFSMLSGGELQKIAIFACLAKNADVYILDEPCTYLDIKERLKLAIYIKEIGTEKKVYLVEHDLAILDYSSDYCIVFYGEEQAYGIISSIKNISNGINEFLNGFLKNENMRIRNYGIDFKQYEQKDLNTNQVLIKFSNLSKNYENFKFEANEGIIKANDCIGIIGKNALGKSLFVAMLAKQIQPDKGSIEAHDVSIAYKPQYIKTEPIKVNEYLANADDKHALNTLSKELNIDNLYDSYLDELSGGELQKVAIAKTLSTDAQLFILDEPSAFLDIESRLQFSTIINKIKQLKSSTFVIVEHDIAMIELLTSKIMPFTGESSRFGISHGILPKKEGINLFLKDIGITIRRDKDNYRPKINKPNSVLDKEQRETNNYYGG
ncbi:MAG: ribosome biogenesis/translation initiation ATPase RLI [Candidatus Micrarchaeota archaeon]|nr:ribosome biogenesis/translation initiation ATPase RLI [Candidatus Micrarchaeota archaeon]